MATTETAFSLFTDFDINLFKAGKHFKLYEKLGSHLAEVDGVKGTYFALWAPNAMSVSVIGNFNKWNSQGYALASRWDGSGIWEGFFPNIHEGAIYKYAIRSSVGGQYLEKGDPFARQWEIPPSTASVVKAPKPQWTDGKWMKERGRHNALDQPCSVYEVHLGSWRRKADDGNRSLTYRELADELVPYVKELGFTHVEFMPVMEHPFFGSWGYQITGYFAPTSRFGSPEDFAFLVDAFHNAGIGVLLDWVPSHFPVDAHGLFRFDGTALYEHEDYRLGYHPDWNSFIFNYGRNEVRAFLISNAIYWFEQFHIDGMRVDAVASMLYLDYSRKHGQWVPNRYGGRENLDAITLLRELNDAIYSNFPDVQCIAEESTSWPMVSRPTSQGGLGFGMKWMMGWMNDVLEYFKVDPLYRRYHQNKLTFSLVYAFSENFMLPLSHDEVVHGKGSILSRMPGDEWQRFANMRVLYSWMYTHPGTKLLFMGNEFGQFSEWKHDESLLWNLYRFDFHKGIARMVGALNAMYKARPELHELNFDYNGFQWIDYNDTKNCILSFYRKDKAGNGLVVVGNMLPGSHEVYDIGVDHAGNYREIFNSDNADFGGNGFGNSKPLKTEERPSHSRAHTLTIRIAPLAFMVFEVVKTKEKMSVKPAKAKLSGAPKTKIKPAKPTPAAKAQSSKPKTTEKTTAKAKATRPAATAKSTTKIEVKEDLKDVPYALKRGRRPKPNE